MKINLTLFLIISLFTINCFSQVEITIQNLQYTNNGEPTENASSCGTIDLKSSTSTSIDFGINLSKPNSQAVGTSTISIYTKKSSSASRVRQGSEITVQETSWTQSSGSNDTFSASSGTFTINASNFNESGGTLFVVFKTSSNVEYTSCEYSIKKDPVPSFTLTPSSVSLACPDRNARVFTVTPANIPSGATVTYSWSHSVVRD